MNRDLEPKELEGRLRSWAKYSHPGARQVAAYVAMVILGGYGLLLFLYPVFLMMQSSRYPDHRDLGVIALGAVGVLASLVIRMALFISVLANELLRRRAHDFVQRVPEPSSRGLVDDSGAFPVEGRHPNGPKPRRGHLPRFGDLALVWKVGVAIPLGIGMALVLLAVVCCYVDGVYQTAAQLQLPLRYAFAVGFALMGVSACVWAVASR